MPDNDQFARASSSARAVFKVSVLASGEQVVEVDRTALARMIEKLFAACDGVPSFRLVLAVVRILDDEPLFARTQDTRDRILDAIESTKGSNPQNPLSQLLNRAAAREVVDGGHQAQNIAERFFGDMIVRYVVEPKKGLIEQVSPDVLSRERHRLERDMLPVVRLAAQQLVKTPDRCSLSLASHFRRESDIETANLSMEGFSYAAGA